MVRVSTIFGMSSTVQGKPSDWAVEAGALIRVMSGEKEAV
jgi:hypothetical protein